MEEAGEVVQVCGKLLATYGEAHHWEGSNLRDRLEEELGDVLGAIDFVIEHNTMLRADVIAARRAVKLELFKLWHGHGRQAP